MGNGVTAWACKPNSATESHLPLAADPFVFQDLLSRGVRHPGWFSVEAGRVSGWERSRASEEQEPRGQEEAGRLLCCQDPSCGSLPSSREADLCLSLLPGGCRAAGSFPGASSSGEAAVQRSMCLGTPQGAEPSHPGTSGLHSDPSPLSLSPSLLTLHPPSAGTSLAVLW